MNLVTSDIILVSTSYIVAVNDLIDRLDIPSISITGLQETRGKIVVKKKNRNFFFC